MKVVDQMGREVVVEQLPKRIVSLVPSQTELLFDLGLNDEVIGITKFCIYPDEWYRTKNRIGGTKNVDVEAIRKLRPDLIIGNKEENTESDIIALSEIAPIWMSDINSFDNAIDMIESIGTITGKEKQSIELIETIRTEFDALSLVAQSYSEKNALYFIWNDPDYVAGKSTFIDAMIEKIGWKNVCIETRYPLYKGVEIPDIILLSSEPYPFNAIHFEKFQKRFPNAKVVLVDGEMFSWYGSRLKRAPTYFINLLKELFD